mmetsp:Transcript_29770/g.44181  ORF Transcript_29770/g.44181 Transcript_29770/m.44181 type:complete len:138 (+) Transcript_29770:129-542(+)
MQSEVAVDLKDAAAKSEAKEDATNSSAKGEATKPVFLPGPYRPQGVECDGDGDCFAFLICGPDKVCGYQRVIGEDCAKLTDCHDTVVGILICDSWKKCNFESGVGGRCGEDLDCTKGNKCNKKKGKCAKKGFFDFLR